MALLWLKDVKSIASARSELRHLTVLLLGVLVDHGSVLGCELGVVGHDVVPHTVDAVGHLRLGVPRGPGYLWVPRTSCGKRGRSVTTRGGEHRWLVLEHVVVENG